MFGIRLNGRRFDDMAEAAHSAISVSISLCNYGIVKTILYSGKLDTARECLAFDWALGQSRADIVHLFIEKVRQCF